MTCMPWVLSIAMETMLQELKMCVTKGKLCLVGNDTLKGLHNQTTIACYWPLRILVNYQFSYLACQIIPKWYCITSRRLSCLKSSISQVIDTEWLSEPLLLELKNNQCKDCVNAFARMCITEGEMKISFPDELWVPGVLRHLIPLFWMLH